MNEKNGERNDILVSSKSQTRETVLPPLNSSVSQKNDGKFINTTLWNSEKQAYKSSPVHMI